MLEGDPSKPDQEVLEMLIRNNIRTPESSHGAADTKVTGQEPPSGIEEAAVTVEPYSSFTDREAIGVSSALAMGKSHLNTPVVRARSFAVSAQTESSALAMKWITYMTSKEMQRAWSETAGTLPLYPKCMSRART